MRELTREEILEIMCAPATTDEPEESDFVDGDESGEENFVESSVAKEFN